MWSKLPVVPAIFGAVYATTIFLLTVGPLWFFLWVATAETEDSVQERSRRAHPWHQVIEDAGDYLPYGAAVAGLVGTALGVKVAQQRRVKESGA